jgi:Glycosyltransferase 61
MSVFSFNSERLRSFTDITVHPTQELRPPEGAFFRGGPEWPYFGMQILARHCHGAIPRPVDARPLPARAEWPYFDPQFLPAFWPHLYGEALPAPGDWRRSLPRLADAHAPTSDQVSDRVDAGIWCGPVILHFGHMVADFAMRIVGSARLGAATPLVFSLPPFRDVAPPPYFWDIVDHLGADRRRVLLLRKPTRFDRLFVLPQAERPGGGAPSRRHLHLMDAITDAQVASGRDIGQVFVSRARLAEGRFAGEAYIEEALTRAGVTIFHPETADLQTQLRLYRQARTLIFSEGSALHALQLLGHLDADIIVLVRRPRRRMAAASLRPRARSLQYLEAVRGLVHGLSRSGRTIRRAGMSVIDEPRLLGGLGRAGIELAPFWDPQAYAERRDADIAGWIAQRRAAGPHPGEQAMIEAQLRALCLQA